MNSRLISYRDGQQIEVRREGGEWQRVEMDCMDDCGYLDGLDADFDEYRIVDGYINVEPDGMFQAAYLIASDLQDAGLFSVENFAELFAVMTRYADRIDKSSWLPHNKKKESE